MKTLHISASLLLMLVISCSNVPNDTVMDNPGNFQYLPTTSDVFISNAVIDSINAAMPRLDRNMFSEGRTYRQANDTLLAYKLIKDAEHSGGSNSAGTAFKGKYFDDMITVSVSTEYDPASLKLLKEWEKPVNKEFTEPTWSYAAKIRVNYTVTVDDETYQGTFYQQSQINSSFDLMR